MTALVTDNLPLLAGAPNGIKKLRELILELAVRGKLVPQNPSDEPASELLKRIAEEKARLVVDGKIKKQKPLAEVDEQTQPFELPVDWVWTRLGEITNFGITTKKDEIPDDAWVLDLEDIEKDTSKLLQKTRFYERNSLSDKNSFTKGDVLYGKLRPYLNKVLVAEDDGFCTTEILPFRCHGPFVAHYFMIALKSPYFLSYVNAKSYGMKMPRLGTEDGRQAFFPLPPLDEQRRIVAKVDELMALCDRLEAQQANAESAHAQLVQALLNSLTQATDAADFAASWQRLSEHFHTLFTTESSIDALKQTLLQLAVMGKLVPQDPSDEPASELLKRIAQKKTSSMAEGKLKKQKPVAEIDEQEKPFELPVGWEWARFGSVLDFQGGGQPPKAHFSEVQKPGYVQLIQIRDLGERPKPVFIPRELASKFCTSNDVMVGRYGASVGKTFWGKDGAYNVALVKMVDEYNIFNSDFLYQLLKSPVGQAYFSGISRSAQNGFNKSDIERNLVPISPIAEQHRIVAKVDELMALCDLLKTRLTQAREVNQQLASALVEQAIA